MLGMLGYAERAKGTGEELHSLSTLQLVVPSTVRSAEATVAWGQSRDVESGH